MTAPRKLVVAALIAEGDRVLLTQRPAGGSLPLEWELPGGKVELGEDPRAALVRELREEIGVDAEVGAIWDVLFHRYPDFDLVMLVFLARLPAGAAVKCLQVADFEWVERHALASHPILAADRPLLDRMVAGGIPRFATALMPPAN